MTSNLFFIYDASDKNDYQNGYMLNLYVVDINGKKLQVQVIIGSVFFDIKLQDKNQIDFYIQKFKAESYEIINIQPFDSTEKHDFIRLYFNNHKMRKQALDMIIEEKEELNIRYEEAKKSLKDLTEIENQIKEFWQRYDTYSDNNTCHYRKISRENNLELVGWYEITNESISLEIYTELYLTDIRKSDYKIPPKLLGLSWDIETSTTRGPGFVPLVDEAGLDYVYMIQMDFYRMFEKDPIERYCLTTIPINIELFSNKYNFTIKSIYCKTERELLLKFAEIFGYCDPAFEYGFNTGGYDWPFILKKVKQLGIENEFSLLLTNSLKNIINNIKQIIERISNSEFISKIFDNYDPIFKYGKEGSYDWSFITKKVKQYGIENKFSRLLKDNSYNSILNIKETTIRTTEIDIDKKMSRYKFHGLNINNREIKVSTEKMTCEYYYISGTIFLDLYVWARKTFPTEIKNTLDEVLSRCGLAKKIDLPYTPAESSDDLRCMFIYVNAIKFKTNIPLLIKLAVQLSELCKIEYKKCLKAFLVDDKILEQYAVEIAYYCSVDSIRCQELMIKRNILGDYIQFASLTCVTISNVFMNGVGILVKNFYGRIVSENNMLISLTRKGIIEISDNYQGGLVLEPQQQEQQKKRPIADVDFGSMYPNVIRTKNLSHDTVVDLESQDPNLNVVIDNEIVYGKFLPASSKEGLMSKMCTKLLSERTEAKGMMKINSNNKVLLQHYTSKSNALKVTVNSIYGETGYVFSPLYNRYISPSVTAHARYLLKQVIEFAKQKGCCIIYGDTDSFFYTIPESEFIYIDKKYNIHKDNKIKKYIKRLYWYEMIKRTIQYSKKLEKEINKFLIYLTKTTFMKMEYEKTMISRFFQKKQYCGIPFTSAETVDLFEIPDLLVKGMKIIKRNTSQFYKLTAQEILWLSLGFDNERNILEQKLDPEEIIKIVIQKYIKMAHENPEIFKLTAKYDPSYKRILVRDFWTSKHVEKKKGNKMVIDYVSRMEYIFKIIISTGRFYYLITKFDSTKMSEKMWPFTEYNRSQNKIDLTYYFNSLSDICANVLECDSKKAKQIISQLILEEDQKTIDTYFKNNTNNKRKIGFSIPSKQKKQKISTQKILITNYFKRSSDSENSVNKKPKI
jgi:DNA polymerase elongation subunit (family B)